MSARLTRRRTLQALFATTAGISAGGPAPVRAQSAPPGLLRTGHSGEPDSLDPHLAVAAPALIVINDLFESLMTLGPGGAPVPGCAARYAVSSDTLTYTFTLRDGLVWSDGRPITAADFIYSARRLADPKTALTGLASWVDLIVNGRAILRGEKPPAELGVSAPDARTVRFNLVAPTPYFPTVVAFPVFAPLPRTLLEKHGRAWTRPENFVGNGPFRLQEWQPGRFVRVTRNARFHAAREVQLEGVQYRPIQDLNVGLRLFQTGELDTLTNFPPERLDWLRDNMPRELRLNPSLGVTVYVPNLRLEKFRDPRVRRALSLAIDRNVLTQRIVRTGDLPAWGIIPPGMPEHGPTLDPPRGPAADRLREARTLLEGAGYGPSRPLEVALLYHTSEEHKKVAIAVSAMWQAVGVRASLRNAERQVVEVAKRTGDFEIVRDAWFSSYPDPMGFLTYLRADSAFNGGQYRSERFERTIDAAVQQRDAALRSRGLRAAEQIAIDEQGVIPLYSLVSRRLVAQRVRGWRDDNPNALRGARWLSLA
jgi:oligopeptide transport system substrate-binding protein